jgi:ribosomal protein S27E
MESNVFVGHYCPKCGTTIATFVSVGGTPKCPGCGGPLQAAPGGPKTKVLANVTCPGCGSKFGMVSVVGGEANCPSCGEKLTRD